MKTTRLIAAGLFACLGLGLMTGCPVSTVSSTTPSPDANVAPADVIGLNGRLTFDGSAPADTITLALKKLNDGQTSYAEIAGSTANTVAGGYYQFQRSEAGSYKVIYRQGTSVTFTAGNNTVGYLQSKDLDFAVGATMKVDALDLLWDAQPTPFNTAVTNSTTATFTFKSKKVGGPYKYKISLKKPDGTTVTTPDWATPSGDTASVSVAIPQTSGTYTYQILFRNTTGAEKADGYTGESGGSPNIPFTVN